MCKVYISKYDYDMATDPVLNGSRKYLKKDIMVEKQYVKVIVLITPLSEFNIHGKNLPGDTSERSNISEL